MLVDLVRQAHTYLLRGEWAMFETDMRAGRSETCIWPGHSLVIRTCGAVHECMLRCIMAEVHNDASCTYSCRTPFLINLAVGPCRMLQVECEGFVAINMSIASRSHKRQLLHPAVCC